MLTSEQFRQIKDRVMATAALAGVKEFEDDLALILIDLNSARDATEQSEKSHELALKIQAERDELLLLQNGELKKQLRKAQEVINKHVADQIEGLHCVDCVALEAQDCDCPMVVPIFEAMKGYTEKLAPETPFTQDELKALHDSPFKGPDTPWPEKREVSGQQCTECLQVKSDVRAYCHNCFMT